MMRCLYPFLAEDLDVSTFPEAFDEQLDEITLDEVACEAPLVFDWDDYAAVCFDDDDVDFDDEDDYDDEDDWDDEDDYDDDDEDDYDDEDDWDDEDEDF